MPKMRAHAIDCAITGSMSGNTIGLHPLASHLHVQAITWGVSVFAANGAAWAALPPALRALIKTQLLPLEQARHDDLVLMDIQMPEMDGVAATLAIRALAGPVARIPILAMTANVMSEQTRH